MKNLAERAFRWIRCGRAARRFPPHASVAEVVDFCLSQPIAPLQIRSELLALAEEISSLQPRSALELGTYLGGTLFVLCRLAHPAALILSLDLYRGSLYGARKLVYHSFLRKRQELHVITGDSHSALTQSGITRRLGPARLDFLFIDGDHSYEGVKRDFEMYSPLVRAGGLIAFHDIVV